MKYSTCIVLFSACLFILCFFVKTWKDGFQSVEDKTSSSVFKNTMVVELPQHHRLTLKIPEINNMEYRAFNPSLTLLNGKMIYSYRISNYTTCPYFSNKAELKIFKSSPDRSVKSHIILTTEELSLGKTPKIAYLDVPDFVMGNCANGFEDARLIASPDSQILYIIANVRSNEKCFAEMYLIKIPSFIIEEAFRQGRDITVKNNQIVKLREQGKDVPTRPEKNWMPFFDGDDLLFVYEINPHIILKCDVESGICVKIAESYNPKINKELRGGSQARYYYDPISKVGRFIAVAHWRLSSSSYISQIYSFSSTYPYDIKEITPTFIIHDAMVAESVIQFVSGFEITNDIGYISFGENDCDSKILAVPMKSILAALKPV